MIQPLASHFHSSLCTSHSSLLTLHFSLLTPHSALLTPHSSLCTSHSSLLTLHFSLLTTEAENDIALSRSHTRTHSRSCSHSHLCSSTRSCLNFPQLRFSHCYAPRLNFFLHIYRTFEAENDIAHSRFCFTFLTTRSHSPHVRILLAFTFTFTFIFTTHAFCSFVVLS